MISSCWKQLEDSPYCAFARDNFNYFVDEYSMKWREWEFDYNTFNDYDVDQMVNWIQHYEKGFRGHCLFWDVDSPTNFPDWVYAAYGEEMVDHILHRLDTALPYFRVNI